MKGRPDPHADPALFPELRQQLHAWSGISLSPREAGSALSALSDLARARGLTAVDCLRMLGSSERIEDRQRLIEQIAIGTTWFMRESAGVGALVEALARELGPGRAVRVWSAGCSTGQEPYSLAMSLLEAGLKPQILATDINRQALRTAAAARYDGRLLMALPAKWQRLYTIGAGTEHGRIRDEVVSLVSFVHHNLIAQAAPPPPWSGFDAVVCRNVLIYFSRPEATEVLRRLSRACRPGGYILLSAAERPLAWMTEAVDELDQESDTALLRSRPVSRGESTGPIRREKLTTPVPAPSPRPPQQTNQTPPAQPPPQPAPLDKPVSEPLLQEALRTMERGDLARALDTVDGLLARDRLLAPAHLIRGLVLKRKGAGREAVAALRCARFLSSDEAWMAPYNLALLLEQQGELMGAEEAYQHTLAILAAGGRSGLPSAEHPEEALLQTVAEACRARLRALARRSL